MFEIYKEIVKQFSEKINRDCQATYFENKEVYKSLIKDLKKILNLSKNEKPAFVFLKLQEMLDYFNMFKEIPRTKGIMLQKHMEDLCNLLESYLVIAANRKKLSKNYPVLYYANGSTYTGNIQKVLDDGKTIKIKSKITEECKDYPVVRVANLSL